MPHVEDDSATLDVVFMPLKDTVLFPFSLSTLVIEGEENVAIMEKLASNTRIIALFPELPTNENADIKFNISDVGLTFEYLEYQDKKLSKIGTLGRIVKMLRFPDGSIRILVRGIRRIKALKILQDNKPPVAKIIELPFEKDESLETVAMAKNAITQFHEIINSSPFYPDDLRIAVMNINDNYRLADLIADTLNLRYIEKLAILVAPNLHSRFQILTILLNREIEIIHLGSKIHSQVSNTLGKVQREYYLREQLKTIKKIFCGFSGGADSTALLLLLNEYSKKYNFQLKAVHFQHGLRGEESFQDSKFCADFCENRNIDFIEINIDVKSHIKGKESFEDCARTLRLAKWKELCVLEDSAVALGHNSDDRNENIFIRLLRGSNLSGLTSLREIQYIEGLMVIRPLLNYSRLEIEDFLRSNNVTSWREDSSNKDNKILRNYIRNIILPGLSEVYPGTREGIKKAASVLLEDALFIEAEVEKKWQDLFVLSGDILLEEYIKLNNALKIRILRKYLSYCLKKDYIPTYDLLKRIDNEILRINSSENKNKLKIPLPEEKDYFIEMNKKYFKVSKMRDTGNFPSVIWCWKKNPTIKWGRWDVNIRKIKKVNILKTKNEFSVFFPEEAIPEKLKISTVFPGEKMIPFGMNKEVSLKKLFESKKIPSSEKGIYPVFTLPEEDKIIWVAGIRRSNYAPLERKTKILKIEVKYNVDKKNA